MSVVVEGVIDLPHTDLSDTSTLHELLLFLLSLSILALNEWEYELTESGLKLTHKSRKYSWVEIRKDGIVRWDEHYKDTVKFKDELLRILREFYPMFAKAKEIISKNSLKNYSLRYDKEREVLVLEAQE